MCERVRAEYFLLEDVERQLVGFVFHAIDLFDYHELFALDIALRKICLIRKLEEHIKQLGRYEIPVRFHGGVTATIKIWVVRA